MEGNWDVLFGGKTAGKCSIKRCGLYYQFCCSSRKVSDRISRLYLNCGGTRITLGVLVPDNDGLALEKRLAVRNLPIGKPEFYIEPVGQEDATAEFIPVSGDKPFRHLAQLKSAYFVCRDGSPGIILK